jgi:hypothetical protein
MFNLIKKSNLGLLKFIIIKLNYPLCVKFIQLIIKKNLSNKFKSNLAYGLNKVFNNIGMIFN